MGNSIKIATGDDRWVLHVWVSGRVQGVFFRDTTRCEARALGLTGWVRNLGDGRVEAVFYGTRSACESALAFVHRGPAQAQVSGVEHAWERAEDAPAAFDIR